MSLMALIRRPKEIPMPQTTTTAPAAVTTSDNVVMRFRTQGGAPVDLYAHAWTVRHYATDGTPGEKVPQTGFQWTCRGCDESGRDHQLGWGYSESKPRDSREAANQHAAQCNAMPKPTA